ncbi:hypothetical protein N802_02690 [Knoellia sinensis KCTC 19936]|uniref:Bacteriocin biosynthesis cyclodehydratase domain-containing protein n=1 Tax=Knoellia sinensis KCTC 19936 TaxID=1385520 RepID=A0A0A0JD52_9MICO|nr:hypothetical protein [Knoellia sinensis]KGN35063.1 hypothetical protein N802_02690 [Knoellia sinensis KCTC 19936]
MVQPAIVVDGRGGLPDEICRQLRRAGAPRVHGGPFAADAAEALFGLSPTERPAAVILVAHRTVAVEATAPWQRAGVMHLPVTCDGEAATVGPLIVPGSGACWRCHALTAHDLDAVGAIGADHFTLDPVALPPGGLGVLTAAVSATVILAALSGATRLAGVSTELEVDGPSVTHRHWSQHPLCGDCSPSGAVAWPPHGQDTMAG